jgi:hypothetical protein
MTIKLSDINRFNKDTSALKDSMKVSFQKASSLEAYEDYEGLASLKAAEKVTTMDSVITDQEMFGGMASDAAQTMQYLDRQLESILGSSTKHLEHMTTLKSSSAKSMNYNILAKNYLEGLSLMLNAKTDNKYVFSGEDYTTLPVKDITTRSNIVSGIVTSNYYQGSTTPLSVIISDLKTKIEYGINADNEAFQELIAGVHLSLTMFNNGKFLRNDATLEAASSLFKSGVNKIIDLRSKLGNDWSAVMRSISARGDEMDFWKDEKNKISGVDPVDANQGLTEKLTNLQSSYSALGKMREVKLTDYI